MDRRSGELQRIAGIGRWSEREARAALRAWRRSGDELESFAREHGLPPHRLRWWKQRLELAQEQKPIARGAMTSRAKSRSEALDLVPVIVSGVGHGHGEAAVVVRLPDGIEIELRDAVRASATEVARLVAELRRSAT